MKFHPSFLLIKYDCSNLKDIYDVHSVHFGHSEYFVYSVSVRCLVCILKVSGMSLEGV